MGENDSLLTSEIMIPKINENMPGGKMTFGF